jgi:hypothetical protein
MGLTPVQGSQAVSPPGEGARARGRDRPSPGTASRPTSSLWIRNAWWDSFWILSGFPIALGLLALSPSIYLILAVTVLLEHAHFLSPMTLAWSHSDFRQLILRKPMKFIGVPLLLILTTTAIGVVTSRYADLDLDIGMRVRVSDPADYAQPFVWLVVLYFLWNGFHFGMQNFGVLSIYRNKSGSGDRRTDMLYCLVVQGASMVFAFRRLLRLDASDMEVVYVTVALLAMSAMLLRETRLTPRILFILADGLGLMLFLQSGLWGFAIWSVNHWLVALGLSSHVYAVHSRRSATPFVAGLLVAGIGVFWLIFGSGLNLATLFDPTFVVRTTMIAMSVRYGVAFTHFLYDRWLWQFSNPDVRATIGKNLFAQA